MTWQDAHRLTFSGQRRGVRETITGASGYPRLIGYPRDALHRITEEAFYATQPRAGGGTEWASGRSYGATYDSAVGYEDTQGYDRVGNRRYRWSSLGGVITRTYADYDPNDRLGSATSGKVGASFDPNGNTLQFDLDANGAWDNSSADGYDIENRLLSATRPSGNISILYDGDGNRVKKTAGSATTYYIVDDQNPTGYPQVIEERSAPSAAPTVTYMYGLDLISQTRNADTRYYGCDGLGSVRYLTDASGTISDTYTYDAFGIQTAGTGATLNNYRYTGEQWDPDLGRFWTADTFGGSQEDPLSLHRYLYAADNPVNRIDPSGHMDVGEVLFVASFQVATFAARAAPYVAATALAAGTVYIASSVAISVDDA